MQLWPLQEPMDVKIENSAVPRELELRIREELERGTDQKTLEDKYGVTLVRQVIGERNENVEEKKKNDQFKVGDKVETSEPLPSGLGVITAINRNPERSKLTGLDQDEYVIKYDDKQPKTGERQYVIKQWAGKRAYCQKRDLTKR